MENDFNYNNSLLYKNCMILIIITIYYTKIAYSICFYSHGLAKIKIA